MTGTVVLIPDGPELGSHLSRPSWAAAPPGMTLVMKILGSSPMWGLSVPPAMLKPKPEFPCTLKTSGVLFMNVFYLEQQIHPHSDCRADECGSEALKKTVFTRFTAYKEKVSLSKCSRTHHLVTCQLMERESLPRIKALKAT